MLYSRKLLPLALAMAACMAAPTALAQNRGLAQAQINAMGRVLDGAETAKSLSAGPRNPNAATPAIPATPAVPGQSPAVPATPAVPAKKAQDVDGNTTAAKGNGNEKAKHDGS